MCEKHCRNATWAEDDCGKKMTNLGRIRDCWSLVVSNLSPVVMSKDLFEVFRKAGPVFDAFLPKDKFSGRSRGFGFVHFKTEWDANKAIHNLNGRLIGGRRIGGSEGEIS